MHSNWKQIVRLAIVGGIFAVVMVTGVAGKVAGGGGTLVPVVAGVVALLVVIGGLLVSRFYVRQMLSDPGPDRIIAHYHATAKRIPQAPATVAYLSALAAAVYGRFDRARQELEAVEWETAPPVNQGHRLHALALISLLEDRDGERSLRLANEAYELENQEPGGVLQILHDALRIAAGQSGAEAVERVRQAARRKAGVVPAICAWALVKHFDRAGDSEESARHRKALQKSFPNFTALA